jgi:hypothetical protein
MIRRAARETPTSGIGVDCMSIVIPRGDGGYVESSTHTETGVDIGYFPSRIRISHRKGSMAMIGGYFTRTTEDGTPTPAVQADVAKNARCPCGSGRRFKRCCRRESGAAWSGDSLRMSFF